MRDIPPLDLLRPAALATQHLEDFLETLGGDVRIQAGLLRQLVNHSNVLEIIRSRADHRIAALRL